MDSYVDEFGNGPEKDPQSHAGHGFGNGREIARRLYRPCEVWAILNISRDTLFGLLRKRELRSMKVGRLRLIPAEAIDEYVDRKMAEEDDGRS